MPDEEGRQTCQAGKRHRTTQSSSLGPLGCWGSGPDGAAIEQKTIIRGSDTESPRFRGLGQHFCQCPGNTVDAELPLALASLRGLCTLFSCPPACDILHWWLSWSLHPLCQSPAVRVRPSKSPWLSRLPALVRTQHTCTESLCTQGCSVGGLSCTAGPLPQHGALVPCHLCPWAGSLSHGHTRVERRAVRWSLAAPRLVTEVASRPGGKGIW